jgi:hypothetical protein
MHRLRALALFSKTIFFCGLPLAASLLTFPARGAAPAAGASAGTALPSGAGAVWIAAVPVHSAPPGSDSAPPDEDDGADIAADEEEGPSLGPSDGSSEREPSESADTGPPFSLSSRGSASSRGESALELVSRVPIGGGFRAAAGAGAAGGGTSPLRWSLLGGAALDAESVSLDLLLRVLWKQAGASLLSGRGELRWTPSFGALVLTAEGTRLTLDATGAPLMEPALALSTAALGAELQWKVTGAVSLVLRASGGFSDLSTRAAPREVLWLLPGSRAGQWPQRLAGGAGLLWSGGPWTARCDLSYALPANGGSAAEAQISLERIIGRFALGLEAAASRMKPGGQWLGRAALEVRFGG